MSIVSSIWFLAVPLLSEPSGEAAPIPWWLWLILALFVIGLPILTVIFGPALRSKADAEAIARRQKTAPAHGHAAPEAAALARQDDLALIEGIGPKIARTLQDAGITTFHALATTDVAKLQAILDQDPRLRLADPATWPQQAAFAAAGDWHKLEKMQTELKGGRTIE